jgi:3-oxoacyl-[acyl-carrier protein] reductase
MYSSLAHTSVIVTGGTRGIGKGIAKVFGSLGANVTIVGRSAADGEAAVAALKPLAASGSVSFVRGDTASEADCAEIVSFAVERYGSVDVVCANAGIYPERRLGEMTAADIDQVLFTNLKGSMLITRAAIAQLEASGRGRVILTSSITGPITGFPGWSHYGASKAGQLGFMRSAALELAPKRITVNAVLPGNVLTEGLAEMGEDYLAGMRAAVPLGELGAVEDIGYACAFLASEEARYITGQALVVDGGQVLPESAAALDAIR